MLEGVSMLTERTGEKDLLGKRALVIGGSISGKLAARVLSDFFEEVIIVDKGQKGEKQFTRTGVPLSSQGHALLSGEEILENLFPGIVDGQISKSIHRRFSKIIGIPWLIALTEAKKIIHQILQLMVDYFFIKTIDWT